jgi:predicted TIM-barrel fold metal-dependent hydrolase
MTDLSGRIDVHHHMMSPRFAAARNVATGPGYEDALRWTPAASLEQMDKAGIATAMMSNPALWNWFEKNEAIALARENNEFAARMCADHPGRFGIFATIPMPDIDASLREIEYAFDTLHADGIGTTTNYGTVWPGDPAFDPVFDELNRRKAVVFIHPQSVACCRGLTPPVPDSTVEFMFDITRCIASLLYRGALSRFADIRFIFTHGGGALPQLAERIARNTVHQKAVAAQLPNGAMHELLKLHFDIASTTSRPALAGLREFLPITQWLYGTDYPFLPPPATDRGLAAFDLTAIERAAIDRGNAERLFPRLKA